MWTSQGIMGRMLEEIRSELSGDESIVLPPLPDFTSNSPHTKAVSHTTAGAITLKSPESSSRKAPSVPELTSSLNTDPVPNADPDGKNNHMDIDGYKDSSSASSSSDEDNSDE